MLFAKSQLGITVVFFVVLFQKLSKMWWSRICYACGKHRDVHNGLRDVLRIAFLPVGIHNPQNGLKLGICFAFLHNGQIVTQGTQTRLELLMIQIASLVLIKVPVENARDRSNIEEECAMSSSLQCNPRAYTVTRLIKTVVKSLF